MRAASAGSPTRTSTAKTTLRMPDASGIRPARLGLTAKVFLAATLLVVVVLGLTFGLTSLQAHRTADESIRRALVGRRRGVQAFLAGRTAAFAGMSGVSLQVPQFRERLLQRSRGDVLDQAEEYRHLLGASWVLVTTDRGLLVARTDHPEEFDIDLSRGALIAQALSGEQAGGAWLDDRARKLYMAVAIPLRASPDATPQGTLVAAYEVNDTLAQEIKQATGSDVVFFALDTLERPHVVGSTLSREEIEPALVADTVALRRLEEDSAGVDLSAQVAGEHLVGLAGPIRSAGGSVYGGFVSFRSRDAALAAFRALQRTSVVAVGLGIGLALVIAFGLARQIAGPVRRLALATRRVQDGDYSVEIAVTSGDEIGVLSQAFKSLVEDLKERAALVEYMMAASRAGPTHRSEVMSGRDVPRPGSVFANRYDVKEVLGMGGMGVVYRAFDCELQEPVAIKTLRPETLAGESVALERFKQEIRLARKISHRNVVRTYDLGEVNGMYYLTMEYVEGTPLNQLISSRGGLPIPVTLTIGKQLCRALEVAHEQGIVHRDARLHVAGAAVGNGARRTQRPVRRWRGPVRVCSRPRAVRRRVRVRRRREASRGTGAGPAQVQRGRTRGAGPGDSQGDGQRAGGQVPDRGGDARRPGGDRLDASKPGISLILPITARALVGECHRNEVLRQLVAQFRRGVEPQRRPVGRRQRVVVHPIGENRLRVQRARRVPAIRVVGVERDEPDVARGGEGLAARHDRRHRHAVPGRDRGPPLDTMVLHRVRHPRHRHQLVQRELEGPLHQPCHAQPPGVGILEHRQRVRNEVAREHGAPGGRCVGPR